MINNKIMTLLIIALMLLAGCSFEADNGSRNQSAKTIEESKVITFAHKSVNSYFYTIMNESVKRSVEEKGWVFESSVADYDPIRQNQQIINFIRQSPDVIITTAIDSIAIEEVILRGNEADIPMCTIDTNATGGQLAIDVSFDNYKAGELAAEVIVRRLIEKYGEPRGSVFNAYGELTSNAWRLRKEGFEAVINQYPDIEYIARATEGRPELVKETLSDLLAEGTQLDAVHASSEHPGRGLVEALQEAQQWYPFWKEEHVIMVTIDAEPYFVNLINKGYADAAIAQDVIAYGQITIDLLDEYIFQNKEIPIGQYYVEGTYWENCYISSTTDGAKVTIPPYIVDANNSNDIRHWAYTAEKLWGFQYNQ